eukprot:9025500-Pyramimonas_sp.AAC.1
MVLARMSRAKSQVLVRALRTTSQLFEIIVYRRTVTIKTETKTTSVTCNWCEDVPGQTAMLGRNCIVLGGSRAS